MSWVSFDWSVPHSVRDGVRPVVKEEEGGKRGGKSLEDFLLVVLRALPSVFDNMDEEFFFFVVCPVGLL